VGRCVKALSLSELGLFKKILRRAVEEINPVVQGNIAINFATKLEIKRLKKQFYGINRETDVLAFNYGTHVSDPAAEIIICPCVAKERAPEFGQDYFSELALYAIHGILHLAGFDDDTKKASRIMRKMERQVMNKLSKEFSLNFKVRSTEKL